MGYVRSMGFQFAETMSGAVEWSAQPGVRQPLSFEVTATASSTREHLRDGKARLSGAIHAPPLAPTAAVEGVITIRLFGERIIRYELAFTAADGKPYTLVGQKDIRWLSPTRSFTYLPAEIFDDAHRRVGTCETTFNVERDLWSFVRSFRPA